MGWTPLNSGEPTHASYRTGSKTAPDLAVCSRALARRVSWSVGPDLGSDHLPMITEVRTAGVGVSRVRKPKWAFHKADWVAFTADYEAAFSEAGPQRTTAQELATRFNETVLGASAKHIPRGARANPKPWALDLELQAAMAERREAHRQLDPDDPPTRERWVASKQRAAEAEKKTSQKHFRKFVETTLNKPASVGRVSKILKAWERSGDDHRPEQALREEGRLLASDRNKAEAFNRTYAYVSRQVREAKLDRAAKRKVTELVDSEAARRAQASAAPAAWSSTWRNWRTTSVACPRRRPPVRMASPTSTSATSVPRLAVLCWMSSTPPGSKERSRVMETRHHRPHPEGREGERSAWPAIV